ncbi:hypothetical protein [Allisonella histaminiformans]
MKKTRMQKFHKGKNTKRFPFWRERADHLRSRWGKVDCSMF